MMSAMGLIPDVLTVGRLLPGLPRITDILGIDRHLRKEPESGDALSAHRLRGRSVRAARLPNYFACAGKSLGVESTTISGCR
jgi:hypothetical protein